MEINPIRFQTEQDSRSALRIPVPIDVFQLQTTVGTIFTARSDADFQVESLIAVNVTGTADYVTVYLVPSAGTAGMANTIVYQRVVPAKSGITIFDRENTGFLQPGMTLEALCGTNDAVNIYGHGYDYQGVYS